MPQHPGLAGRCGDPALAERFAREARTLGNLNQPAQPPETTTDRPVP